MTAPPAGPLRVVVVAEHASARFGGEAILPLHWFRELRAAGHQAWLVVHGRTRAELEQVLAADRDRLHFVPDTFVHKLLWRCGRLLPHQLDLATFTFASHLYTQLLARRVVRRLVREHAVDVVHQPIPVSPKEPSLMYSLGAPVVIGPLNGNMDWPAWYRGRRRLGRLGLRAGRVAAAVLNRVLPGKRRAAVVLVANERTRAVLPGVDPARVRTMVENGVDLALWRDPAPRAGGDGPPLFAFLGRMEEAKALPFLLRAFAAARQRAPMRLELVGDGALRAALERQVDELGLRADVTFTGWLAQADAAERLCRADALVLPSLRECGGAVVLEAMALGLPVVATRWGGPADYLDDECGVLVDPTGAGAFVAGMAAALVRVAGDPDLRRRLGAAGRRKVLDRFDWRRRLVDMTAVYREAAAARGRR